MNSPAPTRLASDPSSDPASASARSGRVAQGILYLGLHWVGLSLLCLGVATSASALVYAPISDAHLRQKADRVVLGEVVEVRDASASGAPATDVAVRVEEAVWSAEDRGAPDEASRLTLRLPGGVGGGGPDPGPSLWIPGTPRLQVGDRAIFFLSGGGQDGAFRLTEHALGLFHVVPVAGRSLAVRALGDAAKVFVADTDGQGALGLSTSVERFEEWPRELDGFLSALRRPAGPAAGQRSAVRPAYAVDPTTLGADFGDKFTLLLSRGGDDFGGCGENGGHPVRRFLFDGSVDGTEGPQEIGWRLHLSAPEEAMDALEAALAAWTYDPASTVAQVFEGLTSADDVLRRPDGVNTVRFDDPYDDIPGTFDGSGVLALGGPWFFCELREHRGQEFHEIAEADIIIQNGVPEAFAELPWPGLLLQQLLAHELGHTLGFGHTDVPDALMQASLYVDPRGPALEPDDLAALAFVYGDGSEIPRPTRPDAPQAETGVGPFVRLSWPSVDDASNYRIERRRVPGSWMLRTTTPATEFEDLLVDPEVTYDYRLRSQSASGASGATLPVRLTTGASGEPPAPSQLRSFPVDASTVGLRWQTNHCDVESQVLSVDQVRGFRPVDMPLDGDETQVLLTGLRGDTAYRFRLEATNAWGTSPPSEIEVAEPLDQVGACVWRPVSRHLCLDQRRYEVSLEYRDEGAASWRAAIPRTDDDHRGFFSFFDGGNLEVEVSVVETTGGAQLAWTSLTHRPWRLHVTDTVTGTRSTFEPAPSLCTGSAPLTGPSGLGVDLPHPEVPEAHAVDVHAVDVHAVDVRAIDVRGFDFVGEESAGGDAEAGKRLTPTIPCGRAPTELHLLDGRFRATLGWWDEDGVWREARALDLTDATGGFEKTTDDELGWLVKVLDGRGINGRFWLFAGPTSASAPFEAELRITDLETGVTRIYRRPAPSPAQGTMACSVGDITAFGG